MNVKCQIDTKENREFLKKIREGLFSFGHQFPSPGGSSYYLGDDGTPWKERNREAYVTCRMAHVYSMASFLGHEGSETLIDEALRGLLGELKDKENGGWYAGLTSDNEPLPMKQCYAHAFVILAATSGILAGREGERKGFLEDALATYDKYFWKEDEGLSSDTWNTEFTVEDDYRGLNANMHTVEAFLAAADVTKDEKYRARCGRIIDHVLGWARDNSWRIPEHLPRTGSRISTATRNVRMIRLKPYGATPGHGLEWALITQWALTYHGAAEGDFILKKRRKSLQSCGCRCLERGRAPGIVYTTDWDGTPVVHDRMHWTLAEGINTAAVLYRVTGSRNMPRITLPLWNIWMKRYWIM